MKVLGVSGGPDSMLLLHKYRDKKIVAAHVNYNVRKDSGTDQKIVKQYCEKNNIPFELLNIKKVPKSNFQAWARDQRLDFFKKIYDKYEADELLLGHHKGDFLETALMQLDSKREPKLFGIAVKNFLKGMNVHRPFIKKYWKNEILELCDEFDIKFAIDSSNDKPVYTRNKKRIELKSMSLKAKEQRMSWFKMSNKILAKKQRKVDYLYKKWLKRDFSIEFITHVSKQEELVFEFIVNHITDANITKKKLQSIVAFIEANNEAKEYKISDDWILSKKNKVLKLNKV